MSVCLKNVAVRRIDLQGVVGKTVQSMVESEKNIYNILQMQSLNHKPLIRRDCSCGVPEVLHNANTRSERQWLVAQDSFHPPKHFAWTLLFIRSATCDHSQCGIRYLWLLKLAMTVCVDTKCLWLQMLCVITACETPSGFRCCVITACLIPSICGCWCCVWPLPVWYKVVAGAVCDHCMCDTKCLLMQVLCVIASVCDCRCCVWSVPV